MIRAIVTDIEGTTSSLSFVKDILFPYARAKMAEFVRCHREDPAVAGYLKEVPRQAGEELDLQGVIDQLERWMDEDRKVTPLKALQGMIWEFGYRTGAFQGHVYPDAVETLRRWHANGIRLYVYSSGSVQAQKLLFACTEYGDLTPLFTDYFDTHIGAKVEADSYRRIVQRIGLPAAEILFLSDIRQELDAAREAGMETCCLVRDGAVAAAETPHPQARDFACISLA